MTTHINFENLPEDAFIRQHQLVTRPGMRALSLLPFSGATLWRKVRQGTFPAPRKVSGNITAWRVGDVREWLRQCGGGAKGRA